MGVEMEEKGCAQRDYRYKLVEYVDKRMQDWMWKKIL